MFTTFQNPLISRIQGFFLCIVQLFWTPRVIFACFWHFQVQPQNWAFVTILPYNIAFAK